MENHMWSLVNWMATAIVMASPLSPVTSMVAVKVVPFTVMLMSG